MLNSKRLRSFLGVVLALGVSGYLTLINSRAPIVVAAIVIMVGALLAADIALAAGDAWCPSCSSDFCQGGGGDWLLIIGGNCYCCTEISIQ